MGAPGHHDWVPAAEYRPEAHGEARNFVPGPDGRGWAVLKQRRAGSAPTANEIARETRREHWREMTAPVDARITEEDVRQMRAERERRHPRRPGVPRSVRETREILRQLRAGTGRLADPEMAALLRGLRSLAKDFVAKREGGVARVPDAEARVRAVRAQLREVFPEYAAPRAVRALRRQREAVRRAEARKR